MTDPNAQPPQDPQNAPQPPAGSVPPQQPYQGQQQYQGQQPYQGQPQYSPGPAPLTQAEDKQWAFWGHLSGILGFIPPLIIWLIFKDRGPFTNQEAKEALNFQITVAIFSIGLFVVLSILTLVTLGLASPLFFLAYVPGLVGVIFAIIAGVTVNNGGAYRYFFAIRMIK